MCITVTITDREFITRLIFKYVNTQQTVELTFIFYVFKLSSYFCTPAYYVLLVTCFFTQLVVVCQHVRFDLILMRLTSTKGTAIEMHILFIMTPIFIHTILASAIKYHTVV